MAQTQTTSVFATANTPEDEVQALIAFGAESDGTYHRATADHAQISPSIKYSRAWLIVRRAYLEAKEPNLLVDLKKAERDEFPADKAASKDEVTRRVVSPIVSKLRDDERLSWGEIAVRVGISEAQVRSAYRATGNKKDIGLRIGKGGKFAYSDPTLYADHRASAGAHIPVDLKGRPDVTDLLNADDPAKQAPAKKPRAKKAS